MIYRDRQDAGKQLAEKLGRYNARNSVLLALPRGGAVVAYEAAKELNLPFGLVLVRKIGHPSYPEYAIGAIAENEDPVFNTSELAGIDANWLERKVADARKLIKKRRELYYGKDTVRPEVSGKTAILIDDGIATGLTMEASARAVRSEGAGRIVVAVPVASEESVSALKPFADDIIVLDAPENFLGAVGNHYREFAQVNDKEVKAILRKAA